MAQDGGEARGVRAPPSARTALARYRRRRAARPPGDRRGHARAGRAARAAAPGRGGARPPEAARDQGAGAEGGGILVPRDLRDDRMVVHEGEPAAHGGPARVPAAGVGNRARRRLRSVRAAALGAGRRGGERGGPRPAPPAHEDLPQLPSRPARVPGDAGPGGERRAGRRRWRRATTGGPIRGFLESLVGAAQHKTAALGDRLHAAAELAIGQKVAVVAASAAALAGGGTALDEFANHDRAARAAQVAQEQPPEPAAEAPEDPSVPLPAPPDTTSEPPSAPDPAPPAPAEPAPAPPPPPPSPADEFDPTGSSAPSGSSAPPPAQPAAASPAPAAGGASGGEFSP